METALLTGAMVCAVLIGVVVFAVAVLIGAAIAWVAHYPWRNTEGKTRKIWFAVTFIAFMVFPLAAIVLAGASWFIKHKDDLEAKA